MTRSARFRELLKNPPFICLGAHHAVTAKLAEQAGAPAIYASGFAASAIVAGQPDFGMLSQTEMFDLSVGSAGSLPSRSSLTQTPVTAASSTPAHRGLVGRSRRGRAASFEDFNNFIGLPEVASRERSSGS